ncbi:unnamed protein product [Amoebophrya sp. A120]|nr:unnamed protein product [Amoebophrya sp. A120]|eukprot:GSA120T00023421001.1
MFSIFGKASTASSSNSGAATTQVVDHGGASTTGADHTNATGDAKNAVQQAVVAPTSSLVNPTGAAGPGGPGVAAQHQQHQSGGQQGLSSSSTRPPLPSIQDDYNLSICKAAATFPDDVAAFAKELEERIGAENQNVLQHLTKHDLYRFIRARKGNLELALEMLRDHVAWRQRVLEHGAASTSNVGGTSSTSAQSQSGGAATTFNTGVEPPPVKMKTPAIDPKQVLDQALNCTQEQRLISDSQESSMKNCYAFGWCGRDRDGRPVYVERLGGIVSKEVEKIFDIDRIELMLYVQQEHTRRYKYLAVSRLNVMEAQKVRDEIGASGVADLINNANSDSVVVTTRTKTRSKDKNKPQHYPPSTTNTSQQGGDAAAAAAAATGVANGNSSATTILKTPAAGLLQERRELLIYQNTVLLDLRGGAVRSIMWSSVTRKMIQLLARVNSHNYPESCAKILVVGAPWGFETFFEKIVKRFLDPKVAEKVVLKAKLQDIYPYIEPAQLPDWMGGDVPLDRVLNDWHPDHAWNDQEFLQSVAGKQNSQRLWENLQLLQDDVYGQSSGGGVPGTIATNTAAAAGASITSTTSGNTTTWPASTLLTDPFHSLEAKIQIPTILQGGTSIVPSPKSLNPKSFNKLFSRSRSSSKQNEKENVKSQLQTETDQHVDWFVSSPTANRASGSAKEYYKVDFAAPPSSGGVDLPVVVRAEGESVLSPEQVVVPPGSPADSIFDIKVVRQTSSSTTGGLENGSSPRNNFTDIDRTLSDNNSFSTSAHLKGSTSSLATSASTTNSTNALTTASQQLGTSGATTTTGNVIIEGIEQDESAGDLCTTSAGFFGRRRDSSSSSSFQLCSVDLFTNPFLATCGKNESTRAAVASAATTATEDSDRSASAVASRS